MPKLSIQDLPLQNQKVLLRVDFNVPIKEGRILDDSRIKAALPTIQYLIQKQASVVIMSHLGRPKQYHFDEQFSLAPVAKTLENLLGFHVPLASSCIGEPVRLAIEKLTPGRVLLLENLRFHEGEQHPDQDPEFAKILASYGDVYINDAFGASHRKDSSIFSLPQLFPNKAAMGFLVGKELQFLGHHLLHQPKKPFVALLGGAKVSSKIGVLESLISKIDYLLLAGGMGYTFLKAMGKHVGKSLVEESGIALAQRIINKAQALNVRILLPSDVKAATICETGTSYSIENIDQGIPDTLEGLDIGPATISSFCHTLQQAATIFWNGPVGVYEVPPFNEGSLAIANFLKDLPNAITVIGGGDAAAVASQAGAQGMISHISTGGGASLEFLEHGSLPGIEVLSDQPATH